MDKSDRIKDEILGILSFLSGIIVLISLLSHSPWDSSPFTHLPKGESVKNLLGPFGSYLSDTLLQLIGFTSYIIPLILSLYGLRRIFNKERKPRLIASIGLIILILSLSSLLSLVFKGSSGGITGFLLSKLSLRILSTTGSYLLFIPLMLVTVMFLLPFSVVDFIKAAKNKIMVRPLSISTGEEKKSVRLATEKEPPLTVSAEQLTVESYRQGSLPFTPPEPQQKSMQKLRGDYELPGIELLKEPPPLTSKSRPTKEDLLLNAELLEKKLQDFLIEGKVTHVSPGPVVTMFEFEPAPGVKIHKVMSLSDDLALALKAVSVRVFPIPGRATIGVEVPNKEREDVFLKEIIASDVFRKNPSKLILTMGKDIFGSPVVTDLGRMPHLLVAGATGSGKSVAINSMVLSLLYRATPRELKMIMIDPKMIELPVYDGIPHLMLPVIVSPKEATASLKKVVLEMERRYRLLAETGVRNIETYNKKVKSITAVKEEPLPYLVIFIDELADLMFVSAHEVEDSIARLSQMARAAGIHLILATQRPSVDVLTGVIKANFSSRISFQVSSKVDSRVILDTYGAEKLLGKGDMLFMSPGSRIVRIHGTYVSEEEIKAVVDFIKAQGGPDYALFETLASESDEEIVVEDTDELYQQAKELVLSTGQASISYIQRRLKIGYNRAARIIEMMEAEGLIGPPREAGKPRAILRKK